MFINKEEALRRLTSSANLASAEFNIPRAIPPSGEAPSREAPSVEDSSQLVQHKLIDRGFVKQKDLLGSKRTAIAKFSIENPRIKQDDVALLHGVSKSEVAACKSGRIGGRPANELNKGIRTEIINNAKDIALEKLMLALGLIDEEKLSGLESAKDIGRFSKDMASVYNSLTAQTANQGAQVNLIVYAPKSREEASFKVVDV
jgi:hypothetical protein